MAEQPGSCKNVCMTEAAYPLQLRLKASILLMEAESSSLKCAPVAALASASSAVEAALKLEEGLSGSAKGTVLNFHPD